MVQEALLIKRKFNF